MAPEARTLRTARLLLRPLHKADVAALCRFRNDPEVARYQSWDRYLEADAVALIATLTDACPGTPGAWFQWGITLRSSGALIGDCGLKTRSDPRLGTIGYTLGRDHQGQGLATEALRAVIDLAFGRLAMHRLDASVDADNLRSLALLERLGWRREAHHRRSVWFKGAWRNDVIYAQLQSEWRPAGLPAQGRSGRCRPASWRRAEHERPGAPMITRVTRQSRMRATMRALLSRGVHAEIMYGHSPCQRPRPLRQPHRSPRRSASGLQVSVPRCPSWRQVRP